MEYEEDEEVMLSAQKLLHPASKGDPERAKGITMDKIIEIHQFMVSEMQKVLNEFKALPAEVRGTFTGKGCETTAELLVSVAVEQRLSVHCEDIEHAVILYEEQLASNPEFAKCTEQLANLMQHLIGSVQPRVEKELFLKIVQQLGEAAKLAKSFAKNLFDEYRSKTIGIAEAYRRFEAFSKSSIDRAGNSDLPELSNVEMQLCYDEYREDKEVQRLWELSGADSCMMMQAAMSTGPPPRASTATDDKKVRKIKSGELIEMQELMVDELKRMSDAVTVAVRIGSQDEPWRAEIVVQMIHALASCAVERRYGITAEEMTSSSFQHAAVLQKSERFMRASERQHEILVQLPKVCSSE